MLPACANGYITMAGRLFWRRRLCPHVGDGNSHSLRHFESAPPRLAVLYHAEAPAPPTAQDSGGLCGSGRPDERPHPYIVQLLKNCVGDIRFTDAVEIPGIVEPIFHESVHLEIP